MPDDHQEAMSIAGLAAGDHLCCIYETEDEHRAVVTPFVRIGIERGERVMYIVDAHNAETILAYLAQVGFDPKPALARGQFVLATRADTYLRNGIFDPDAMLDFLQSESDRAAADGYPALRVTGEMTWALRGDKGAERLMEYEAKLNRFLPGSNVLAICQYHRRRFAPEVIKDVLRTHPFVVYRGQVYKNFYYVPVEEFLGGKKTEVEVAHWLDSLQRERDASTRRSSLETEQRRVMDALCESELRYRSLAGSMHDGVAVYQAVSDGEDFVFVDFNFAASRIDSVSREKIVGRRVTEVFPGVKDFGLLDVFRRVWRTGTPEEHPVSAYKDGRIEGWRENFVYKLPSGEIVAVYRDVTALKQAQEVLRFQKMLLESQNEASIDGILIVDTNGKILWFNRRFLNMWRIPPDLAAAGSDNVTIECVLGQLVDPESFLAGVRRLYADQETRSRDEIHLKDGGVFDRYSAPVLGEGDTYLGRVWLFRDVTEKTKLLASLAQADRLASMGMLAAGVAHEINNPLTYVLGNLESLSENLPKLADAMRRSHQELSAKVGPEAVSDVIGDSDATFNPTIFKDVVEQTREALAGTERIKEILRGLGTFSRVEQTDLRPVDVPRVVEDAVNVVSNEIKYRARLIKDLHQVPAVLGSDGKLAQVFLNLLMNAAHAIGEGHVAKNEIRVRTWAEGNHVFAEVSDTGTGIAPEHRSRIFEPFFTTKSVGVGSGLGLSICKSIITGFGGEISFESEVGQGTRFLVRLPAMPDDPKAREEALPAGGPAAPRLRGRILVVDDVAGVRKVLTRLLASEHEVVAVSSGVEGQAILEQDQAFDLLFFDLMMPQMSGMDLHEWLAQRNPVVADRVVFMTGGVFTPRAREYLANVRNPQVAKPFDVRALKKMVSELVLAAKTKGKQ